MHARKIAVASFALAFGLTFAAFAGAAADAPASETAKAPQAAEKTCCKHHDSADAKDGKHCDHATMKAEGGKGETCCARHAAMHKDGASADGKACCARHAGTKKGEATAEGKACCAEHAQKMKDGGEGCCCCAGEACPHPAAGEAPAKS